MKPLPPIVIDSREQNPFPFTGHPTQVAYLRTGDYSLAGFESAVAVERKSWADAWGSAGKGRARMSRCVQRLSKLDSAAIVIECSLSAFCDRPDAHTRLTVESAVGTYISWMAVWGVPVIWCENRVYAERMVFRFLQSWWRHKGAIWLKEAVSEHVSVVAARGVGLSDQSQAISSPSPSGCTPAGVPTNCCAIDVGDASSTVCVVGSVSPGNKLPSTPPGSTALANLLHDLVGV